MIAIKNIEKTLVVSYEGWDYQFPKDKAVFVNEDVYGFIKESFPMAFEEVKKTKGKGVKKIVKVTRRKTPRMVSPTAPPTYTSEDMVATQAGKQAPTFGQADLTPPSGTVDADGVGWYGEGAVIEQAPGKTFE